MEKTGDNAVEDGDICYDADADGILDGGSFAQLVNLDSIDETGRFTTKVKVASGEEMIVSMPKFLQKREEAEGSIQIILIPAIVYAINKSGLTV